MRRNAKKAGEKEGKWLTFWVSVVLLLKAKIFTDVFFPDSFVFVPLRVYRLFRFQCRRLFSILNWFPSERSSFMPTYYVAVDIGASSGRLILAWLDGGRLHLEEVHRFENGAVPGDDGYLVWRVDYLAGHIVQGLKKCKDLNKIPKSVAIDTWGVDYALVDGGGRLLGGVVAYRDERTLSVIDRVHDIVPEEEIYARTGIQKQVFNTIYQLYSVKEKEPALLAQTKSLLMLPSYLSFRLTGKPVSSEYTHATTGALVNAESGDWDWDIIERLGFPKGIFGTLAMPGDSAGYFSEAVRDEVGFDAEVVLPPSHDTASAFLAVPVTDDNPGIYISSGTWSLMGIERERPDCRDECRRLGFTNEGGYGRNFRFLKNIMGLWIVQSLRRELLPDGGFEDVIAMAKRGSAYRGVIDVNDHVLFAPKSMADAVGDCCRRYCGGVPANADQLVACAYNSLAKSYADTARDIEKLSGKTYDRIMVVGGGCRDDYLNELTARYSGKAVHAGPVEATALGNVACQMIRDGIFAGVEEARAAIRDSFEVKVVRTDNS